MVVVIAMNNFVSKHYENFIKEKGYIPDMFNPYNESEITDVSQSLTTCCGSTTSTSSILIKEDNMYSEYSIKKIKNNIVNDDYVGAITSSAMQSFNHDNCHLVVEDNNMIINPLKDKTPYGWHFEQNVYDVNGETRSLKASQGSGNILKIIEENEMEKDINVIGNYSPSGHNASRIVDSNGLSPTVMENHGTITATNDNLRIRKLTTKECFRLMGVKDEDSKNLEHLSNATKYHLAGDSIVVNVLQAIFKSILIDHPVVDQKPIRLIELFGGYGSQSLSLKYLNIPFEHWKLCEWAIHSIDAYKSIHFPNDNQDYSEIWDKEDLIEYLYNKGISSNWNEPMKLNSIKRKSEDELRKIFNNCKATNNLINIQQVHAKDLEIKDRELYNYIVTYSFPCQDLSLAGKGAGMEKGSGTRSGMLWEVERILEECEDNLPQILLMENVPQVVGKKNKEHFDKWVEFLENKGYTNKWCMLNAKEVGYPEPIPQNRNRCFMVSVLDPKQEIIFPDIVERKLVLKDLLENNVDEKYYLSDAQINAVKTWNAYEKPLENMEKTNNNQYSPTLTTRSGAYAAGMILVKNATKQGYLEATDGDGVDISSRMEYHRGTVQKESTQTITTKGGNDIGVVIKEEKWSDLD